LGCSQRYLHVMFLRDIGLAPKHWMNLERMVVARRKLEGGKAPPQVATELGFVSMVTFNRQFKRSYMISAERFVKTRKLLDPTKMTVPKRNHS
jgi:methylphosphotriester-DNA--protein-cysteine methyltransferase